MEYQGLNEEAWQARSGRSLSPPVDAKDIMVELDGLRAHNVVLGLVNACMGHPVCCHDRQKAGYTHSKNK